MKQTCMLLLALALSFITFIDLANATIQVTDGAKLVEGGEFFVGKIHGVVLSEKGIGIRLSKGKGPYIFIEFSENDLLQGQVLGSNLGKSAIFHFTEKGYEIYLNDKEE